MESGFGLEGYEAPDSVYFARGANAVNPAGRQGLELEEEQRLMIESGDFNGGIGNEDAPEETGGIFGSSTLAAIQSVQGSLVSKPKPQAPSGPLVAYDSDSD